MTSSNARPPRASVFGPKATSASRMSSLKSGSRNSTWYLPIGPSWLKITSPCQSLRMTCAKSSICAVVTDGMPNAAYIAATPRPMPSVNRPPDRRCMVVAHEPVISGWRVL